MQASQVTRSVDESSDNIHNCGPCHWEGRNHEAKYFCGTCIEYYCYTCQRHHRKFKMSRDHDIQPLSLSGTLRKQVCVENSEAKFDDVSKSEIKGSKKMKVKLPSDNATPRITGCTFTLLCDHGNCNIKLLGSKVSKTLALRSRPWSIALLDKKTAVVTLPFAMKIQYIGVGSELTEGSIVSLDDKCWGVAVIDNNIFVSVHASSVSTEGELRILDIRGNETQRIKMSTQFQKPYHVAASPLKDMICVSDGKASSIACLSPEGTLIQLITNDNLNGVHGLYVDSRGNIIATSFNNNTVQVISADGTQQKTLLISRDGIKSPLAVAFRFSDGKLVISSDECDEVLCFKLR